jgi:hypothetical protein
MAQNLEIDSILRALPIDFGEEVWGVFRERMQQPESVVEKWDHGVSETRAGGFKYSTNGYTVTIQVTARVEIIREERGE